MKDVFFFSVIGILMFLILGIVGITRKSIYDECKAFGHSEFYCWVDAAK